MVTQTQLRQSQGLSGRSNIRSSQDEQRRRAEEEKRLSEENKRIQNEYNKQKLEYDKAVQYNADVQNANNVLNEAVAKSGSFLKASQSRLVTEAFAKIGVSKEEAEGIYQSAVESGEAYQSSKQNVQSKSVVNITSVPSISAKEDFLNKISGNQQSRPSDAFTKATASYTSNVNRYRDAGYTSNEAAQLATKYKDVSITRDTANKYLESNKPTITQKISKGVSNVYEGGKAGVSNIGKAGVYAYDVARETKVRVIPRTSPLSLVTGEVKTNLGESTRYISDTAIPYVAKKAGEGLEKVGVTGVDVGVNPFTGITISPEIKGKSIISNTYNKKISTETAIETSLYFTPVVGGLAFGSAISSQTQNVRDIYKGNNAKTEAKKQINEYIKNNPAPEGYEYEITDKIINEQANAIKKGAVNNLLITGGLAIAIPLVYTGIKKATAIKEFNVFENAPIISKEAKSKAGVKMSEVENVLISKEGNIISRSFKGEGGKYLESTGGYRKVYSTPLRDFFGMKPVYSGVSTGETIAKKVYNPLLGTFEDVTQVITKKQALKGREKVVEYFVKKGYTKEQASKYISRKAPSIKFYTTEFGGKIVSTSGKKDVVTVLLSGTRKEIPIKAPLSILDIGSGRKVLSISRGGKIKEVKLFERLEEIGTKVPKGEEAGALGEITYFKGTAKEINPTARLGRQSKDFEIIAAAKKTGEQPLVNDFGTQEQYNVLDISKEITYGKNKRISKSISDVNVKVPDTQLRITKDLVTGVKRIEVRPKVDIGGIQSQAEEFILIGEKKLDIRQRGIEFISPANIEKTPLSKTFGEKPKQILSIPKPKLEKTISVVKARAEVFSTSSTKNLPRMVGGQGLDIGNPLGGSLILEEASGALSKTLERTYTGTKGGSSLFGTGSKDLTIIEPNIITGEKNRILVQPPLVDTKFRTQLDTKTKTEIDTKYKTYIGEKDMIKIKPLELNKIAQPSKEKIKEELKLNTKLNQALKLNTKLKTELRQRIKPREILKPKIIKIPRKKQSNKEVLKELLKQGKKEEKFEAFGKRYGKEFSLGKAETQTEAESKLLGFLKGSLGASGKVKKGESELSFGELKSFSGIEFRPSKRSSFVVVQRREKRLGSKLETMEIKKSRGKTKWL